MKMAFKFKHQEAMDGGSVYIVLIAWTFYEDYIL